MQFSKIFLFSFACFISSSILNLSANGSSYTVTSSSDDGSPGTLRYALLNASPGDSVNFDSGLNTILIGGTSGTGAGNTALPYLSGITINGNGNTISGQSGYPIFFAFTGTNTINNLTLMDGFGQGGDGGSGVSGGGGGLGAGGALLINTGAIVNIQDVLFANNSVAGGNGGVAEPRVLYGSGGGGGGLYGSNGGDCLISVFGGGGGGGVFSSQGTTGSFAGGGGGGVLSSPGGSGRNAGGGGGGYYLSEGANGDWGGGGGGGAIFSPGGDGGNSDGGGGGGGYQGSNGGNAAEEFAGGGGGGGTAGSNGSNVSSNTGATGGLPDGGDGGNGVLESTNRTVGPASPGESAGPYGGGGGGGGCWNKGNGSALHGGSGGSATIGGGGGGGASEVNGDGDGSDAGNGGSSSQLGGGGGGGFANVQGRGFSGTGGAGGSAEIGGGGGGGGRTAGSGDAGGGDGGNSSVLGGGGGGGNSVFDRASGSSSASGAASGSASGTGTGTRTGTGSLGGDAGNGGNAAIGGGGGGGGSDTGYGGDGGSSEFGGGGGGAGAGLSNGSLGTGGFGGGGGGAVGVDGDGGSAFGGVIFVRTGGTLNIIDSSCSGSSLGLPGKGNNTGSAEGESFYLMSGTIASITTNTGQTIDGSIAGSGGILKVGSSSLNLEGNNTYSGTTTITQGELIFSGDTSGLMGNIVDNDTLTFDQSKNSTFLGDISGTGVLNKKGDGTLFLEGDYTYTGDTTVSGGNLNLNGSIPGNMIVNGTSILTGNHTIGGTLFVNPGGGVKPGNSIGTTIVIGDYINNNGTYFVEINGLGQSDLIDVTGTAFIDGGLVVVSSVDGTYNFNQAYTIVTASEVVGTYSGATGLYLLQPVLSYDTENVYLRLELAIDRVADTCNQIAVAQQLDGIEDFTTEQTAGITGLISLPFPWDVRDALDQLSGEQYTDTAMTTELINRQFIRRLYDPVRSIVTTDPLCQCCSDCCSFDAWLEAGGVFSSLKNSNTHGFNTSGYQITAGFQSRICADLTFGIAGAYESDTLNYKRRGHGSSHTGLGGIYGLYRPAEYYVMADLSYGYSQNTVHRSIDIGALSYETSGKPDASQVTFYGEVGVDWNCGCVLVQPFGGIEIGSCWRKDFVEKGSSPWNLSINEKDYTEVSSRIGVHLTIDEFFCSKLSLDLAWLKRLSSQNNHVRARFVDFGNSFDIYGMKQESNSFDGAFTISTNVWDGLTLYLEGTGEVWDRASTYGILGGVQCNF